MHPIASQISDKHLDVLGERMIRSLLVKHSTTVEDQEFSSTAIMLKTIVFLSKHFVNFLILCSLFGSDEI